MIQVTFNFSSIAAAAALFGKLNGSELGAIVDAPPAEIVKAVAKIASPSATDDFPEPGMQAPGKPSAATTAPGPSTAAAVADAAPATSTEATKPDAGANSASPPVAYPDLQKAVLALHKLDPSAAIPIAKSLGADTFKVLPEAKWAEALDLVKAKTAELQAA